MEDNSPNCVQMPRRGFLYLKLEGDWHLPFGLFGFGIRVIRVFLSMTKEQTILKWHSQLCHLADLRISQLYNWAGFGSNSDSFACSEPMTFRSIVSPKLPLPSIILESGGSEIVFDVFLNIYRQSIWPSCFTCLHWIAIDCLWYFVCCQSGIGTSKIRGNSRLLKNPAWASSLMACLKVSFIPWGSTVITNFASLTEFMVLSDWSCFIGQARSLLGLSSRSYCTIFQYPWLVHAVISQHWALNNY